MSAHCVQSYSVAEQNARQHRLLSDAEDAGLLDDVRGRYLARAKHALHRITEYYRPIREAEECN